MRSFLRGESFGVQVPLQKVRLCRKHLPSQDPIRLQAAIARADGDVDQASTAHDYAALSQNTDFAQLSRLPDRFE